MALARGHLLILVEHHQQTAAIIVILRIGAFHLVVRQCGIEGGICRDRHGRSAGVWMGGGGEIGGALKDIGGGVGVGIDSGSGGRRDLAVGRCRGRGCWSWGRRGAAGLAVTLPSRLWRGCQPWLLAPPRPVWAKVSTWAARPRAMVSDGPLASRPWTS
jgi:hypothetical protein